jgi:general secretion pathway protein N
VSLRHWLAIISFAVVFVIGLLVMAPAALMSGGLDKFSEGRLTLAHARGTLWNGSGALLYKNNTQFITLGDYTWQLRTSELLTGRIAFDVRQGEDTTPMRVRYSPLHQFAELSQWHMTLPAQVLSMLAPQLRPYQLIGEIKMSTDSMSFTPEGILGLARLDWMQAGSGMTDIYPLGDYCIKIETSGQGVSVQLSTLAGKLQLTGSGQIVPGQRLQFNGTAQALQGDQHEALTEMLHHMGPETSPGIVSFGLASQ